MDADRPPRFFSLHMEPAMHFQQRIAAEAEAFAAKIADMARAEFSSHHKGVAWEADFIVEVESRGFTAIKARPEEGRHDLVVNGRNVQCKNIDECRSGKVSIDNMRPVKSQGNQRGYSIGEYDVLALKHRDRIYLIPASELHDPARGGWLKSKITIEEYAFCIDAWSVFDGEPSRKELLF